MIKYILFDLDGTLTDSKEGITKCVQYALKHFGIQKECDELECFIGPPLKEQFIKYASLSEKDGEKAVEIYRERFAPIGIFENKVYDGVIQMLAKLKEQGKVLAVSTSKPAAFAQKIVDKYGISPYISCLVGSELDGRNTDKATIIKITMDKLGATAEETVMVGDRIHDCEGAEKCGIKCVGVSYGFATEGELEGSSATKLASSPSELLRILSKL